MFLFCLFIIQPCFYLVVKYCFNAICFTRFINVNSVIISSIISCNDLYQDFIIMYVWYFVNRISVSVLGAIWPSLSPCTVINPILPTYLLARDGEIWHIYCNFKHSDLPYSDVIMGAMASQITHPTIVYSTVYSGVDQRNHQSSESLASVRVI